MATTTNTARSRSARIAPDMGIQQLTCATCRKPFTPATYWQRHCSKTCRRTAIMRTYRAKLKAEGGDDKPAKRGRPRRAE